MNGTAEKRPLGRRRRKLYRTVAIVVAVLVVGGAAGFYAVWKGRTTTYSTGEQHEEITRQLSRRVPEGAPQPLFEDVTEAAGLGEFRTFSGERTSQLPEDMGPGAAWGDYDGDGDDDLFLVSAGGPLNVPPEEWAPSELYENLGDGTFARVAGFPAPRIIGMGAAWADHDGDGDLDLVVTGFNALLLYRNEEGRFVEEDPFSAPPGFWAGASWSDFDRDGDLDLYVCGYVQYEPDLSGKDNISSQYGRQIPYTLNPSSYSPERNLFYVNRGDGRFDEAAAEYGVANTEGRSLGALWHDLDDDGWPDLYVANDISDNVLYMNRDGRFADTSHAAWVADYRGAMGLAAGDWNRDGDDDLFVTHWVAQENALYDSRWVDDAEVETDDGSRQPLRFVDRADQQGLGQIALRRVGWGAEFADFDSDGWQDLFVANGSTFEEEGEPRVLTPEPSFLLWNEEGRFFHDLAPASPAYANDHVSRGLAVSDYDRDGDLDVLYVDSGEGVRLLRNDMTQKNWVQLRLRPDAGVPVEGARVRARIGEVVLRRAISGVSYLSQSSRVIHLGLGEATRIDTLEIHWSDGTVQTFDGVEAGRTWEIRQGDAELYSIETKRKVALSREEVVEFWRAQRAAIKAMKVDQDIPTAIGLFEEALEIDPEHEDSIYYLGNCLAEQGDLDGALAQFAELKRLNPKSHRAFKRWGTLRAMSASSTAAMGEAEEALLRAVEINPEATGAQMVLAETSLVRGDLDAAEQRLRWIQGTNPTAADAMFLLGYVEWKRGDSDLARQWLGRAAESGEDWRPEGVVAEGDVERAMHRETTLLGRTYAEWDRSTDPGNAYQALDAFIRRASGALAS